MSTHQPKGSNMNAEAKLPPHAMIEFLLARIADDEATIPFLSCECSEGVSEVDPLPTCPDRIAADLEGRRLLVEGVRAMREDKAWLWARPDWFNKETKWTCDTPYVLRCLSLPYADHPDYREEWKP